MKINRFMRSPCAVHNVMAPQAKRLPAPRIAHDNLLKNVALHTLGVATSLSLLLSPPALAIDTISSASPVFDGANVLSQGAEKRIQDSINQLESSGEGWRVRVLTKYTDQPKPDRDDLRAAWGIDKKTVVLLADPSSPNVLRFNVGEDILFQKMSNPFWFEIQGKYGNKFFVEEFGVEEAVLESVKALTTCLALPDGCKVVPGVSQEQAYACFACAVAGGLVFGFACKLQPPKGFPLGEPAAGIVLFSPLWFILFVNFGLGPVVSRSDEAGPIAFSTVGFVMGIAAVLLARRVLGGAPAPGPDQGGQ